MDAGSIVPPGSVVVPVSRPYFPKGPLPPKTAPNCDCLSDVPQCVLTHPDSRMSLFFETIKWRETASMWSSLSQCAWAVTPE